jgi:PKD repeat protein
VSATAVTNYGWPAYEGAPRQPGYDGLNLPVLENLYAAGPSAVVTPYFAYRHTDKVVAGSLEPTGGSSVSGVAFYGGGSYPAAYQDALFFSDYSRNAVYVMHRGVDGLPDPASRQVFRLGVGSVDLVTGPGGDLFVVDHANKVYRFTYNSANRPPDAVLTADRTSGPAPLQVQFSAAGSTDPDAVDTLRYEWDLDGDGAFDDSTAVNPTYAYTEAGTYVVRLRVTDPKGASDVAQVSVTAGNTAPVPTITSPAVSLRWKVGDVVSFGGTAADQQDGALGASNLRWQLILRHENATAPGTYHEHVVQEYAGVAGGTFVAPDHEYPSSLELRLTATDSGGLVSTTAVVLQPMTSTITFASNVAGARISFNGESVAAPFSRTVIVGSASSIVATTPQAVNGVIYNFVSWSNGGAATQNIVATAADATYTATFAAAATVPVPWQARDVGAVGLAGTSAYDAATGTFTVAGAGANIWGTEDSFHYLHQQVTGDVQIVARVRSTQRTHGSSKAGLQIRQSLAADAANVQIDAEGAGDWGEFHVRPTAGGETATRPFTMNTPHWLRLTRVGDVFTASRSVDGQAWEQIAQETVVMTGPVLIGLAVCAHDTTLLNTAVFDNVSVAAAAPPNARPTITAPAAATVNADNKSAAVTVTATDDGGAAALRYTWAQVSGPATAEFSSSNGTNAGRALTATFARAGTYVLRVTVADALGAASTSDVTVNVQPVLTDVVVTPIGVTVTAGGSWQFAAVARDQFLAPLTAQPAFAWTVDAGGVGTVSAAGLYAAPATGSGSATVRATAGGRSGTAAVAVTAAAPGDVTSGLVNRWRFDENAGTLADDAVGPNNGTLTNGATWAAG